MLVSNAFLRPPRRSLRLAGALLGAALVTGAGLTARADGLRLPDAEILFRDGIQLLKAGKAAQACPKLAESQRLDPALGTEFRLAECYETLGRTASAWAMFNDVADKSRAAGKSEQEKKARGRADLLAPKLSTLKVVVPDAAARQPGLDVSRDNVSLGSASWGTPMPVDPGKHTVRATATNKRAWVHEVKIEREAGEILVTVPPFGEDLATDEPSASIDVRRSDSRSDSTAEQRPKSTGGSAVRPMAFVVGGLALVGLGVGATFGALALSKDSDWTKLRDAYCDSQLRCDPAYTPLLETVEGDRSRYATFSNIGFIAGGVSAVGAIVLWIAAPASPPAPQSAFHVAPMVGSVNGAVLWRSF